jgi:hypothetical protein
MTSTQMRQWWDQLEPGVRAAWLHAYQNGPTRQLVDTLPDDHRPGTSDEWINGAEAQWDNSPMTIEWFLTTEFKAFVADEYEKSVGGTTFD